MLDNSDQKEVLPSGNKIPAVASMKHSLVNELIENVKTITTATGKIFLLKFTKQIAHVIERNYDAIEKYSVKRASDAACGRDFTDLKIKPFKLRIRHGVKTACFHLVVNADGVSVAKSRPDFHVWPVWIAIAELPPKLRSMKVNLILASLWCGSEKPNYEWDIILKAFKDQLHTNAAQQINVKPDGMEVERVVAEFFPLIVVADLPAKANMLNMKQYNGFFSCNLCLARGLHVKGRHLFPFSPTYEMRSPSGYQKCVNINLHPRRTDTGAQHAEKCKGVKGKSILVEIFPNVPLSIIVDYMHQVLIGVFKYLLKLYRRILKASVLEKITIEAATIVQPKEIHRKIQGIESLNQLFKVETLNI